MKSCRSLCGILLVLVLFLMAASPLYASAGAESGTCGDNISWVLDGETLTISGSGAMSDYDSESVADVPWYSERSSIVYIEIKTGITSIGSNTFYECLNLESVTISDTVTCIGDDAFRYCCGLTGINLPNGIASIGSGAFYGCTSMTGITIPDSVGSIGLQAFCDCIELTSITLPESVLSIGDGAFSGCTGLTHIALPLCITDISDDIFNGCSNLTGITIPAGVTCIGSGSFSGCSSLTGVIIPESVTKIGSSAFMNCKALKNMTIPASVTEIQENTFMGCACLTDITLPGNVSAICEHAFSGCTSLTDVYYLGTKDQADETATESENECLTNAAWHYMPLGFELQTVSGDRINHFLNASDSMMPAASSSICNDLYFMLVITDDILNNASSIVLNIELPEGFSFGFDTCARSKESIVISRGETVSIPVYPLNVDKGVTEVIFKVTGDISKEYPYAVDIFEGTVTTELGEKSVSVTEDELVYFDGGCYNEHLAWLGDVLSFGVYYSSIEQSLNRIGFRAAHFGEYVESTTGIGYCFAVRSTVEGSTIHHTVVAVIRGTSMNNGINEWLGNAAFADGTTVHSDFNRMAKYIENLLSAYCFDNQISKAQTSLFVTGHSRGAAVAGLIVHDINSSEGNCTGFERQVAYTFAAPNNTTTPNAEVNIHNILYYNDMVPYVPFPTDLFNWGKYGNTYMIGGINDLPSAGSLIKMYMAATDIQDAVSIVAKLIRIIIDGAGFSSRGIIDTSKMDVLGAHGASTYLNIDLSSANILSKPDYIAAVSEYKAQYEAEVNAASVQLPVPAAYTISDSAPIAARILSRIWSGESTVKTFYAMFKGTSSGEDTTGANMSFTVTLADGTPVACVSNTEVTSCNELYGDVYIENRLIFFVLEDDLDYQFSYASAEDGEMDLLLANYDSTGSITDEQSLTGLYLKAGRIYSGSIQGAQIEIELSNKLLLPDHLLEIDSGAFAGTAAEIIIIPSGVESIAADAFDNCPNLVRIINHSSVIITPPSGVEVVTE